MLTDEAIIEAWRCVDERQGRLGRVALWDLASELGASPEVLLPRVMALAASGRWTLVHHDWPARLTASQREYCIEDPLLGWVYAWIRPRRSG